MPAALGTLFCSAADVATLLSQLGVDARLDDDASGTVSAGELAFLTTLLSYATERVKFYCCPHYDAADLATSWLVNEWATIIATHRLCLRRVNPVPDSVRDLMFGTPETDDRGVLGDLKAVQSQAAQIPDIGYRTVPWPAWSNVTVDPRYRVRQIRVQRPISERTVPNYSQAVDHAAEFFFDP